MDLLNRVPPEVGLAFAVEVLIGERPGGGGPFSGAVDASLHWETQVPVLHGGATGFLDILLSIGGQPVLAVENKIGAPLRTHAPSDGQAVNQLQTYGRWLGDRAKDGTYPTVGVLLTHASPPPANLSEAKLYGVSRTHCARWRDVWRWLKQEGRQGGPEIWRVLAMELATFLEENSMTSDLMRPHDLAAAEMFVQSYDRISATFDKLAEPLKEFRRECCMQILPASATFWSEAGILWSWLYLKPPYAPSKDNWYIAWGIRFPTESARLGKIEGAPEGTCGFVMLWADWGPLIPTEAAHRPKGWLAGEGLIIKLVPLYTFGYDPEALTMNFSRWIHEAVSELKPKLQTLAIQAAE